MKRFSLICCVVLLVSMLCPVGLMSDDALRLIPPRQMSIEAALEFISDDELLEITPKSVRIRKKILSRCV